MQSKSEMLIGRRFWTYSMRIAGARLDVNVLNALGKCGLTYKHSDTFMLKRLTLDWRGYAGSRWSNHNYRNQTQI
jgi:hypothetical protein